MRCGLPLGRVSVSYSFIPSIYHITIMISIIYALLATSLSVTVAAAAHQHEFVIPFHFAWSPSSSATNTNTWSYGHGHDRTFTLQSYACHLTVESSASNSGDSGSRSDPIHHVLGRSSVVTRTATVRIEMPSPLPSTVGVRLTCDHATTRAMSSPSPPLLMKSALDDASVMVTAVDSSFMFHFTPSALSPINDTHDSDAAVLPTPYTIHGNTSGDTTLYISPHLFMYQLQHKVGASSYIGSRLVPMCVCAWGP